MMADGVALVVWGDGWDETMCRVDIVDVLQRFKGGHADGESDSTCDCGGGCGCGYSPSPPCRLPPLFGH